MSDKEEESWIKAVGTMIYYYLAERTSTRVSGEESETLAGGQFPENPSRELIKAWEGVSSDLYYRLRSARTKRIFAECFTRTVCSIPQGKLNRHLEKIATMMQSDESWEELRDVMMLSVSAKSYRRESNNQKTEESKA